MAKPNEEPTFKSVGGLVPTDLAWRFKAAYISRRETAQEALTHALQLYLDIGEENTKREGN